MQLPTWSFISSSFKVFQQLNTVKSTSLKIQWQKLSLTWEEQRWEHSTSLGINLLVYTRVIQETLIISKASFLLSSERLIRQEKNHLGIRFLEVTCQKSYTILYLQNNSTVYKSLCTGVTWSGTQLHWHHSLCLTGYPNKDPMKSFILHLFVIGPWPQTCTNPNRSKLNRS